VGAQDGQGCDGKSEDQAAHKIQAALGASRGIVGVQQQPQIGTFDMKFTTK
jgi:hypothetical protein